MVFKTTGRSPFEMGGSKAEDLQVKALETRRTRQRRIGAITLAEDKRRRRVSGVLADFK